MTDKIDTSRDAVAALLVVLADVDRTERDNTRNPRTDYYCRKWVANHARALLARLAEAEEHAKGRQEVSEQMTIRAEAAEAKLADSERQRRSLRGAQATHLALIADLEAARKWADDLLDAAEQAHRDGGAEMHRLIRTPPDILDADRPARPKMSPDGFASTGAEDRWCEHNENACPHCGGSGHKGDIPARPAPVTVEEAALRIMLSSEARDSAFEAMWRVAEKHSLEVTNASGARYSITGDVVNELYYAALRVLAEEKGDE